MNKLEKSYAKGACVSWKPRVAQNFCAVFL